RCHLVAADHLGTVGPARRAPLRRFHDRRPRLPPGCRRPLVAPPLGLELLRLMLELVQRQVDRRVEVVRLLLREHGDVVGLERDLGDVPLLRDAEDHVRVGRATEVLADVLVQLVLGVGTERRGGRYVPERHRDAHRSARARFFVRGRRGGHRRGFAQYTCLRFEEGRMPISSRYFATVRRAMSICSLASISAMYWSLSGFLPSSLPMISRIFSLTLSAETSEPWPPRRLEVKKYLSSNVPCGVWTYLPAVARLTVDSCMPMSLATSFSTRGRSADTPFSRNSCWNFTMLDVTM